MTLARNQRRQAALDDPMVVCAAPVNLCAGEHKRTRAAASRFFLRIGQAGEAAPKRDEHTLPLFGLPLIMDAEGVLARDARHLVNDEAEYMRRVRELLYTINLEMV